jgi:hypothetical protein
MEIYDLFSVNYKELDGFHKNNQIIKPKSPIKLERVDKKRNRLLRYSMGSSVLGNCMWAGCSLSVSTGYWLSSLFVVYALSFTG